MNKLFISACFVLWTGVTASADVQTLLKQMQSKNADERRAAARALGDEKDASQQVVSALIGGLKDPDFFVQRFCAQSLGKIGPDAKAAVPYLIELARSKSARSEVVEAAAAALGSMGPSVVPTLADVVKNTSSTPAMRRQAAVSLGKMGKDARAAIPALVEASQSPRRRRDADPNSDIRIEVVTALGEIATANDKGAVERLEAMQGERIRDRNLNQAINMSLRKIKARK
jgi:HEAT repeat protein